MSWLADLAFRARVLRHRTRLERELDDELGFHFEEEVRLQLARGGDLAAAERAARLALGSVSAIKEECRDSWGVRLFTETGRDLLGAARHFRRAPAFSVAAVLSMALGIGGAADRLRCLPEGHAR